MRSCAIVMMAVLLAGCETGPPFKDLTDEYRYLKSLSNPTQRQWMRKQVLSESRTIRSEARMRDTIEDQTDRMVGE